MKFDHVNGMLRPYVEHKIDIKASIKEIRMSLSIDYEVAKKGLIYFLLQNGYFDVKKQNESSMDDIDKFVKKSKLKLRY